MIVPAVMTNASNVQARELDLVDFDAWRTALSASSQGSVYGLPEYLEALSEATGGRSGSSACF